MQQTSVESTALVRVSYDAAAQRLAVEFRDRTIHQYRGVPAELHAGLLAAESKGKFFNAAIRNRFPSAPITDPNGIWPT